MKNITQEEFDALTENSNGIKVCPENSNYEGIRKFGANCEFGAYCKFGKEKELYE